MRTCGKCKKKKTDSEYAWRNKSKGTLQNYCKECQRTYRKEHYEQNKDKYIRKANRYSAKVKQEHYEWLANQNCMDCGVSDVRVLEFDHVRGEKLGIISKMVSNVSAKVLEDEIAKCEIVCANCHKIRTADRGGFYKYLIMPV